MKSLEYNNLLFKFKSLRTAMLIPFIAITSAAVLSFMLISVEQNRETALDMSTDYTMQLITMVNEDIDSYFSNMENIAQLILNNEDVSDYLYADAGASSVRANMGKVQAQFETLKDTRDDIYNIGIVGKDGKYFINDESVKINPYADYTSMDWYKQAVKGNGEITSSHVQNLVDGEYKWVVTLSRGIKNPETGAIDGVLFIDLNYSSISSLCEKISLGSKGYVFIIDEEGNVIYHPKQQLLYSGILEESIGKILERESGSFISEGNQRLYTISKSDNTGWTVVGVAYIDELLEKSRQTQILYIVMALSLILIATIISVFLADAITKPIRTLRTSMKQVEKGDFEIQIANPGYNNEIGDLMRSFNIMIERIRELIKRNVAEQEEKRKSEFKALQAQINPHFLYNTLDSIIWMAESDKNKEVILMTSSLSKLLRRSISNQEEVVSISAEIDYVSDYLKIQQMRYHDKLEYNIDIDSRILHQPIAKLILQPLVENAIYHGIKLKAGKGKIDINGTIIDGNVEIRITDDGPGMDEETLTHILEEKKEDVNSRKVGVQNVNRRIQLYCGVEYGLRYESELEMGTSVCIILPYNEQGEGLL